MRRQNVRELALKILLKLNDGRSHSQQLIDKAIESSKLNELDKALLTELVYGTIRWRGKLDWVIASLISPKKLDKFQLEIIEILRLGLYQLMFLDKVPAYAVVNESVKLSKSYGNIGASGLVNAVLRRAIRDGSKIKYPDMTSDPCRYIAVQYSHPPWMVERWLKRYGFDDTVRMCETNNTIPPLNLRVNTLRTTADELCERLEKEGLRVAKSETLPVSLNVKQLSNPLRKLQSYKDGLFTVQDEASMLVSYVIDPKPGELIIDACSAPGTKSTHLAEFMRNEGKVIAIDIDASRLEYVRENCLRLGIKIVDIVQADSRHLENYLPLDHQFIADRILVDAPCSGLGVLRRRAEIKWRRTPEQIIEFSRIQLDILKSVSNYLKPGGVLVYSTCTIEPEENQEVIRSFLSYCSDFTLESVAQFLPSKFAPHVSPEGYIQTYPHLHGTDGFFIARLVKKAGAIEPD